MRNHHLPEWRVCYPNFRQSPKEVSGFYIRCETATMAKAAFMAAYYSHKMGFERSLVWDRLVVERWKEPLTKEEK